MRDHVFSGADVSEALALAAANLGLPLAELRYVVLDPGAPGSRGLSPTPARIAVLLQERGESDDRQPQPARAARSGERAPAERPPAERGDPLAGIERTLRAIAEAGGLGVSAEVAAGPDRVEVQLQGDDREFFLEPDGEAEVLRATEHLLLRLYGAALKPLGLRLTGEGFRERRDDALVRRARRVAETVRQEGRPRTLESLNAYERRVVHVALQDEPGVRTESSGEGAERRLTIAPSTAPGDPAAE
jgi:spoIIIJ-associated protein